MKKRVLFLSINGAIAALNEKRVRIDDLNNGLFCLTFIRERFFEQLKLMVRADPNLNAVYLAVKMANEEGRCIWQEKKGALIQYGHLNLLLQNNGFKASLTPAEFSFISFINPTRVEALVKAAGLADQLRVIE